VPRIGDADFTEERLRTRAAEDLAGGVGNLVHRVTTMVHRFRGGVVPVGAEAPDDAKALLAAMAEAPDALDAALYAFDFRAALAALWTVVTEANRYVERAAPWALAKAGDLRLDGVLAVLVDACRLVAAELEPFVPDASARLRAATSGRLLPVPEKVFG